MSQLNCSIFIKNLGLNFFILDSTKLKHFIFLALRTSTSNKQITSPKASQICGRNGQTTGKTKEKERPFALVRWCENKVMQENAGTCYLYRFCKRQLHFFLGSRHSPRSVKHALHRRPADYSQTHTRTRVPGQAGYSLGEGESTEPATQTQVRL